MVMVTPPRRASVVASALLIFTAACGGGSGGGSSPSGAPAVLIPRTGQVASQVQGDDASLQRGVAWPSPRFTPASGGKTMVDRLTGLMWARSNTPVAECGWQFTDETKDSKTWPEGLAYVACLNSRAYLGHSDWRMPNLWEMRSLVQNDGLACDSDLRLHWLVDQGFQLRSTDRWQSLDYFFTSTPMPSQFFCNAFEEIKFYWSIDLCGMNGRDGYDNLTPYKGVWPVRDAEGVTAAARLPATGFSACFDGCSRVDCAGTGQDGELRKGVAWPSPRFVIEADSSVRDRLTGLLWAPNGNLPNESTGAYAWTTWGEAFSLVAQLNEDRYLGHDDWRLPNVNELETLVLPDIEETSVDEQLWAQGLEVSNAGYWSSTWGTMVTDTSTEFRVWTVGMVWGEQTLENPMGDGLALPVRGP